MTILVNRIQLAYGNKYGWGCFYYWQEYLCQLPTRPNLDAVLCTYSGYKLHVLDKLVVNPSFNHFSCLLYFIIVLSMVPLTFLQSN